MHFVKKYPLESLLFVMWMFTFGLLLFHSFVTLATREDACQPHPIPVNNGGVVVTERCR